MSTSKLLALCLAAGISLFAPAGRVIALEMETPRSATSGWKVPFEGSTSSPVVVDGRLFVGSADGSISAFDVTTGKRIWRFKTGKGLPSGVQIIVTRAKTFSEMAAAAEKGARKRKQEGKREIDADPIVDGGTVYIGSRDHFFYALDAETGKPRWAVDTGGEISKKALLHQNLVLIPAGNGFIEAVDKRSGARRWSFETLKGVARKRPLNPILDGGVLFVTSWPYSGPVALQSFLQAIDASTGELRWEVVVPGGWVTSPEVEDGRVFFASNTETAPVTLYAVDAETGTRIWDYAPAKGGFPFEFVLVDSLVLFQFNTGGRPLTYSQVALDQATGEVRWQMSGRPRDLFVSGLLYLSSGKIEALDPATGTTKWSREDARRIRAIVGGDLLVAWKDELAAIDASTGEERWRMDTGTPIHAVPVRSGPLLFFPTIKSTYFGAPSEKGHLFAVDAETGPPGG